MNNALYIVSLIADEVNLFLTYPDKKTYEYTNKYGKPVIESIQQACRDSYMLNVCKNIDAEPHNLRCMVFFI